MLESRSLRWSPRIASRAAAVSVALITSIAAGPSAAFGQGCPPHFPVVQTPQSLWGSLRPTRVLVDSSSWSGSQFPGINYPITTSVDIENGWVFTSWYRGLMVYDGTGAKASNPERTLLIDGGPVPNSGPFPYWPPTGEFTQLIFSIDAPEGVDTIAAVGGYDPIGVSIWDTTNKSGR